MIMKNKYLIILSAILIVSCAKKTETRTSKNENVSSYVDPFIGTGGHGHTYPGATVPFGMLQVSPVNGISEWDWCSGYHYSDDVAIGFSHLSLSGTGIGDLADILFMPVNKAVDLSTNPISRDSIPYKSSYSHKNEKATPGYYQVFLENHNVNVELTTSKRTAYHKYTFKEGDTQSVVINLGFAINWDKSIETFLKVEDEHTISGYRYSTGWAKNQKVFFVAKFSKPIVNYKLSADGNTTDKDLVKGIKTSTQLFFDGAKNKELLAKVALSSVSVENAKDNLDAKEETFETTKSEAETLWNSALSQIVVETPTDSLKTIFYTALYHAQLAPVTFSDKNGQFRLENDSIVTAKNYTAYSTLSLWDTFRAEHPLLTLIAPDRVSDMVNSMLAFYDTKKILPVWTLYGNETNTMTGYHSIPVIVDAYQKGIRGFDAEKAYEAMKNTMMQDDRGLIYYKKYGFIPYSLLDESVTITLEYAYDDWCVAQMARALGKEADYQYFLNRSKAYQQLFDKKSGFMRGKSVDGKSWNAPFDPKHSNHREQTDYTEGNAWQHSWFVPQAVDDLIAIHGGNEIFTSRLEKLFTESSEITGDNVSADITGLIGQYAHGNEPSHHIAYMFNHANQPWRTQYWARHIMDTQYNTTPNGLSGNEDCGQMSAWYVLSSIGLYPMNPASGEYEIGSPIFEKSTIKLPENKTFMIEAEYVSHTNFYIQSATLNGKPFTKTTLSHQDILKGGTLHFVMGNKPNKNWGIKNKAQQLTKK
ncbi:MAG TPA: GH92 family glycosyl hydrolase [Flavobacterium sp.]|uniref:GH92 family glycosyl hydrolase n=1 Tax=Flavobacterium sp. TaxID=239 RepID=UPI001B74F429|nr:GH92 family glycosyl hydrolase [Flavobacterium sp.]MBP7182356.1 GH92 family glycosyl hydrolase [Flavobacterium sp.]MBP7316917.1 GH92 family glycosyl hydrolase [Flavobacterium sp.]MBP8887506.1 GH92 family glycosyl hydrolase [Flavobacterium sp.]HRL70522.1 GH92 family glycosyl hydrolase [Flavobacterium sp.]HRN44583.1 GH92 family glycosyl hydrolase [Flavobacterium sp.]